MLNFFRVWCRNLCQGKHIIIGPKKDNIADHTFIRFSFLKKFHQGGHEDRLFRKKEN